MKKNKLFILSLIIAIGFAFFSSCVKENWEYPETVNMNINYRDSANYKVITIKQLKALYDGDTTRLGDSLVVEGTVISSDSTGNIYQELYIQDSTGGTSIKLDLTDMYIKYRIGQKLAIKLGGLYIDNYKGMLKIGGMFWDTKYNVNKWSFGNIQGPTVIDEHVIRIAGGAAVLPRTYKIAQIPDSLLATLIRIENVQFSPELLNTTFAYTSLSPSGKDCKIIDAFGGSIIVRNSSYSTFAGDTLPELNGSINCIYSIYNTTKQLLISDKADINFTNPRF